MDKPTHVSSEQNIIESLSKSEQNLYNYIKDNTSDLADAIERHVSKSASEAFLQDVKILHNHNLDEFSDSFYNRLHTMVTNILQNDQTYHISEFLGDAAHQVNQKAQFKFHLNEVPEAVYNVPLSVDERMRLAQFGESSLLTFNTPKGEHIQGKLFLMRNLETDQVDVKMQRRQSQLKISDTVAGQKITKEDLALLKEKNFTSAYDFGTFQARFKVDTDLNKVVIKLENELVIPRKFAGIELTEKQRTDWINGKPVLLEGMKSKKGEFTGYVTFDQKEKTVTFSPINPKEKVALEKVQNKISHRETTYQELKNNQKKKTNTHDKITSKQQNVARDQKIEQVKGVKGPVIPKR